jgi:hypothetical protein
MRRNWARMYNEQERKSNDHYERQLPPQGADVDALMRNLIK